MPCLGDIDAKDPGRVQAEDLLSRVFARLDAGTSVRLLTSGEYGHGSADEALVHHIEGNSWAGWDTKALVFLQDRWPFLMVGTLILIAVLASP